MELRKIASRKSVKFLTLLLTAMLIGTASAAVYYSINMQPTVTISQATVIFVQGSDWTGGKLSGSMGDNNTYVSLSIKAYPNATLTYTEPLNVSNTDLSNHIVYLSHVSISPNNTASVSNFTFINFTLIQPDGNPVSGGDFDYYTSGDIWNAPSDTTPQTLIANTDWAVKIETKAAAGATNATTCTIVIAVNVQE